jgi:hypothetical protein
MRSVANGMLEVGTVRIPIKVYVGSDDDTLNVPGSLYHVDCHAKIRESQFCEKGHNEDILNYSAVMVGDELVPISSQIRDELLDRKLPLRVVSAHPLSLIPELMSNGTMVPVGYYRVLDMENKFIGSDTLVTLLDRLSKKKRFLLIQGPISGPDRYAILMPNGAIYPLAYQEELREFPTIMGGVDREHAKAIDEGLKALEADFPTLTAALIIARIQAWFKAKSRKQSIVSTDVKDGDKKTAKKTKVAVNA